MSERVAPIRVLQARAEARALLFANAEYDTLDEAIAPLMRYAHQHGLIEQLGAAAIYALIEQPFAGLEHDGD